MEFEKAGHINWRLDVDHASLGIIEINMIAASTPEEGRKAVEDLQSREATALIMDLRDNAGGLLSAGVDIAGLFLESGVVMENQYRDQKIETYQVDQAGPFVEQPLVVLVNENTASAAEIVAGAMKVHQRATIIGMPTYGKDSIQLVYLAQRWLQPAKNDYLDRGTSWGSPCAGSNPFQWLSTCLAAVLDVTITSNTYPIRPLPLRPGCYFGKTVRRAKDISYGER